MSTAPPSPTAAGCLLANQAFSPENTGVNISALAQIGLPTVQSTWMTLHTQCEACCVIDVLAEYWRQQSSVSVFQSLESENASMEPQWRMECCTPNLG